jgi:hypothetical protein
MDTKPKVRLSGTNGNTMSLLALCNNALRKAGLMTQATELTDKVFKAPSYEQALSLMEQYCDVS